MSENPKVSIVIPAMNESKTIAAVIRQARKVHSSTEVIVVVNGSRDGTELVARKMGARVIEFKDFFCFQPFTL
ncbi:glycosyltransferase [Paenibacillus sp. GP183]|uniref:glycosyltransferase n=1 Tax=Paenibacillus sp. GP183 TaxID=1882751 RepID=UPI00089CF89A|nr:Glycosyl transferase family 2 [Paenibacillus sp. GP183]